MNTGIIPFSNDVFFKYDNARSAVTYGNNWWHVTSRCRHSKHSGPFFFDIDKEAGTKTTVSGLLVRLVRKVVVFKGMLTTFKLSFALSSGISVIRQSKVSYFHHFVSHADYPSCSAYHNLKHISS
jgi:hypothetical protein